MNSPKLDQRELLRLAGMYHLLGDPNRLKVMLSCLDQAIAVSDMADRSGVSLSLVSHHLRLLRMGGLVVAERRGRQMFYSVADRHVAHMLSDMLAHVTQCVPGTDPAPAPTHARETAKKNGRSKPIAPVLASKGVRGVPARLSGSSSQ